MNNFYNTPHRKVRTLFPPKREKSATFLPYPHSSSQRHAHMQYFFPFRRETSTNFTIAEIAEFVNTVGWANLRVCRSRFARATTHAYEAHSPLYCLGA